MCYFYFIIFILDMGTSKLILKKENEGFLAYIGISKRKDFKTRCTSVVSK